MIASFTDDTGIMATNKDGFQPTLIVLDWMKNVEKKVKRVKQ